MCSLASQQAVVGALARMASIVAKLLANRGYCRGAITDSVLQRTEQHSQTSHVAGSECHDTGASDEQTQQSNLISNRGQLRH